MSSLKSSGAAYTYTTATYDGGAGWMTDGNYGYVDGYFRSLYYKATVATFFVRVNLGAQKVLDYVRFAMQVHVAGSILAPTQVVITGSNNDVDYDTLGTFVQTTDWSTAQTYPAGGRMSDNLTVAGTYQYVKFLWTTADEATSINEVEIYGDDVVVPITATVNYLKGRPRTRLDMTGISAG